MFWNKKLKQELAAKKLIIADQNKRLEAFNTEIGLLYKQIQNLNIQNMDKDKLLKVYEHEV